MKLEQKIKAFTLIELLIVVAIIAILAAIAVPNFLEAQVRAKISRVKNDMRAIDIALESYMVDYNNFPYPKCTPIDGFAATWIRACFELSTPIAYMTSTYCLDPFAPKNQWQQYKTPIMGTWDTLSYVYVPFSGCWGVQYLAPGQQRKGFHMFSWGPSRTFLNSTMGYIDASTVSANSNFKVVPYGAPNSCDPTRRLIYDSTNGTVSYGEIVRSGGDMPNPPTN